MLIRSPLPSAGVKPFGRISDPIRAGIVLFSFVAAALAIWSYVAHESQSGPVGIDSRLQDSKPASIRHHADFVQRVLSPNVQQVTLISEDALTDLLNRLRPKADAPLSHLLHACHLFGPDATFLGKDGHPALILPLFIGVDQGAPHFREARLLARTRYGLRFPLVYPWLLGTDQSNAESHPGQGLATLAQLGISPHAAIQASRSETLHVSDILSDVKANFALEGEFYWDAIALTLLAPPDRTWTNKFGKVFSFDDLAESLVASSFENSPCAGSHKLIALTVLLRADGEASLLSDAGRQSVRVALAQAVALLDRTQLPDGAWPSDWYSRSEGAADRGAVATDPAKQLIATGHHLEWLLLLPSDLQIRRSAIVLAAERSISLLRLLSANEASVRSNYCPLIHAARSVRLLMSIDATLPTAPAATQPSATSMSGTIP